MKIGYARVSTTDQQYSFENQIKELNAAGCEKIYQEKVSAVGKRPEFDKMVEFAREGDAICVLKLDRAFRSVSHMGKTIDALKAKKVTLKVLDMNLDTSTPTGELIAGVMTCIASFELSLLKERQQVGIKAAQAEGKFKGRQSTTPTHRVVELKRLGLSIQEIATQLQIGRATVYRHIKKAEKVVEDLKQKIVAIDVNDLNTNSKAEAAKSLMNKLNSLTSDGEFSEFTESLSSEFKLVVV